LPAYSFRRKKKGEGSSKKETLEKKKLLREHTKHLNHLGEVSTSRAERYEKRSEEEVRLNTEKEENHNEMLVNWTSDYEHGTRFRREKIRVR